MSDRKTKRLTKKNQQIIEAFLADNQLELPFNETTKIDDAPDLTQITINRNDFVTDWSHIEQLNKIREDYLFKYERYKKKKSHSKKALDELYLMWYQAETLFNLHLSATLDYDESKKYWTNKQKGQK